MDFIFIKVFPNNIPKNVHIIGDKKPEKSLENKSKMKSKIEEFLNQDLQEYLQKKGFKLDGADLNTSQLDSIYETLLGFYNNLRQNKATKSRESQPLDEKVESLSLPSSDVKGEVLKHPKALKEENIDVEEDSAEEGKSQRVRQVITDDDKSVKININLNTEEKKKITQSFESSLKTIQQLFELISNLNKERIQELGESNKEIQMENMKLSSIKEQIETEKENLNSKLEAKKNEVERIKKDLDQQEKEFTLKKQKIILHQDEIQGVLAELLKLEDKVDIPVQNFERSNKELMALRKAKLDLINYKQVSLQRFSELESRRKGSILNEDKLKKKHDIMENTYEKLQILIEQELNKKAELEAQLKNKTTSSSGLDIEESKLKDEIKTYDQNIQEQQGRIAKHQSELKELNVELVQLEKQMDQLRGKLKEKEISLELLRKKQDMKLEELSDEIATVKFEAQKNFEAEKEILQKESQKIKYLADLQERILEDQKEKLNAIIIKRVQYSQPNTEMQTQEYAGPKNYNVLINPNQSKPQASKIIPEEIVTQSRLNNNQNINSAVEDDYRREKRNDQSEISSEQGVHYRTIVPVRQEEGLDQVPNSDENKYESVTYSK